MAEAIVGPLLNKLQEVVVKEAKALAAVGGEIDKLRDKLSWLHALVHEADLRSRQDGSRLVRVLAFQIRDAGFDVEDAVDQFYLRGSLSRRFGRHNWWRISKEFIFNLRTHVFVRAILSRRIRSINARLEEIIGNNSTYSLSNQSGSADGKTWRASRAIPPMRTDWDRDYSKKFVLKYRSKEKKEIMEEINKKDVSEVITVVGVEGVGKTALLMHVYKHDNIKKDFNVRIWLSFPPDISDEIMLKQIQEKLGSEKVQVCCLVVVDSPVSTTTRRKVENKILKMVGKGSKILLSVTSSWCEEKLKQGTTIELGPLNPDDSKDKTHCTIKLGTMNEADSTKLFNHIYDLGGRRGTKYQVAEMNHIRSNIMEITNGLPLAVVLVAKLMRTMDFGKWEAAADYLKCNSEDNKLKTILSVCIDDLSDELKSCLLYTAGFPENRHIDARQLVRLWLAEGFLTRQHKLETEQLGQCYLKELIYRGLLHLKKKVHGGHVQWVAIPDQIHPLLRSEAQRTSFMDVHYGGSLPPPGNTRRLALHNYNYKFPALENCLDKLRTVVSYSDDYMDYPHGPKQEKPTKNEPEAELGMREFFQGSPYLRVINLEGIQVVVKKKKKGQGCVCFSSSQSCLSQAALPASVRFRLPGARIACLAGSCLGGREPNTPNVCALPHEIREMVHLQYLGVRCRGLKKVPSSVGNLSNLQTIDVRGTDVRKLPKSLWKIKTLRHVIGDLLALPRSTGDLKLMHTLETVTIDQVKRGKEFRLRSLHRLHVAELNVAKQGEALKSVLMGLSSLEALILSGNHIPVDLFEPEADTTDSGTMPDREKDTTGSCMKHVEYLKLDGQLHLRSASSKTKLDYYSSLHSCLINLTHLVLRSTKIGQDFIHWIGKLPVLAELELLECSYEDDKMIIFCAAGFNCLTRLKISGLDIPKEITVVAGRKKDIDIHVPDPDTVKTDDKQCSNCNSQPPLEQQPGTAAAGSDDHQHANGGEDDQANHGHTHTEPHQATTTTTTIHGHGGNYQITEEDGNPLTKMILEAVKNKNESTKTDITDYIKTKTKGDSLDIALQYMVQSGKLRIAEPQSKRPHHHNKYILAQPSLTTGQESVEQTV